MNVLFLLNNYPGFRGIEKVTRVLTAELCRQGVQITILSLGTDTPEWPDAAESCVMVPNREQVHSAENVRFVADYLAQHDVDFVVYQDSYAASEFLFREIDYPWREKLIVAEHSSPLYAQRMARAKPFFHAPLPRRLVRLVLSLLRYGRIRRENAARHLYLLNLCRHYVLLSERYRADLQSLCGRIPHHKISAITNPLTIAPAGQASFARKKQMLFAGALADYKGVDYLLNIWKRFRAAGHEDWTLVMAGNGPQEEHLRRRIRREHIEGVQMLGVVAEMATLYEESSLLLMTSVFEGVPLVLNEAMSRGCVPLAFGSFSSVYDLIDDGVNGRILPAFHEHQYTAALAELAKHSEIRERMARAAMEKAHRFSPEAAAQAWRVLFCTLHGERMEPSPALSQICGHATSVS